LRLFETSNPPADRGLQSALDGEILARSDSAGASHDLVFACREARSRFSLGYAIGVPVREGILALPGQA
jgi:hypothetical protein